MVTKGFLEEGDARAGKVTRWQSDGQGSVTVGPRGEGQPIEAGRPEVLGNAGAWRVASGRP